MEQKPTRQEPKASIAGYLWPVALGIGTAVGAGIGAAMGSVGAGIGIGVGVGVVVGLAFCRRLNSHSSDD
jgi:hypothetical protein